MDSNSLSLASSSQSLKLRAFCYSLALWGGVIFLCLTALLFIQLGVSTSMRERLFQFLTDYPFLVGFSSLLPLMAAGALMIYLLHYRHACYTFHSSLLTLDVEPKVIASTIETGWNAQNKGLPITCNVLSTGRALKVFITASTPPEEVQREHAKKLHDSAIAQLQSLLVAKHPMTFHIQWN